MYRVHLRNLPGLRRRAHGRAGRAAEVSPMRNYRRSFQAVPAGHQVTTNTFLCVKKRGRQGVLAFLWIS